MKHSTNERENKQLEHIAAALASVATIAAGLTVGEHTIDRGVGGVGVVGRRSRVGGGIISAKEAESEGNLSKK
jgi:hypothetical protein